MIEHTSTVTLIEDECRSFLEPALLGKFICAYGEDGFGQHGRHHQARWYRIKTILVGVDSDDIDHPTILDGKAYLVLEGYDSNEFGHIATDKNFEIALTAFLKAGGLDPAVLSWPEDIALQGDDNVALLIDIPLLLNWA